MSSFILSSWGKALIQFFHSVSIKLLDFFRSVYCSLNLFQALSKAVDQNWVHFTLSDFSFLFEFLLTGTQSNSCLCNRTLYSQLFRDNWSIIDILNILPVLLLIQESLQVLESLRMCIRKYNLKIEESSFYIQISVVNSPVWKMVSVV